MNRELVVVALGGLLLSSTAACVNAPPSETMTLDGGSIAPNSDAGGPAERDATAPPVDAAPLPATLFEACIAYAEIQCEKDAECSGRPYRREDCPHTWICPDYFDSPGVSVTIEDIAECVARWRASSCDHFHERMHALCRWMGTRPDGESCRFPTQCAGGFCSGAVGQCGSCYRPAEIGESCWHNDQCQRGVAACQNDVCVPIVFDLPLGASCTPWKGPRRCDAGLECRESTDGSFVCAPPRTANLNEPCPDGVFCPSGAWCNDGFCRPLPGNGESCRPDFSPRCEGGMYCDGEEPGTCRPQKEPGASCELPKECLGFDLDCRCDDEACGSRSCKRRIPFGETCDPASRTTFCADGTTCRDGVCSASERQGLSDPCDAR